MCFVGSSFILERNTAGELQRKLRELLELSLGQGIRRVC